MIICFTSKLLNCEQIAAQCTSIYIILFFTHDDTQHSMHELIDNRNDIDLLCQKTVYKQT